MSTRWFGRRWIAIGAVACIAALATPAFADQPQDAWITTQAKMKLLTAEGLDALRINVDTFDGHVTLHGKVTSAEAQQRAADVVDDVQGVNEVRNLLAVVPEAAMDAVASSDDDVRNRVETVLQRDQALEGSSISVKSVNDGIVVLAGEATTLSAHRRALEDARSVAGVREVASEIRSPNELADREIWEEAGSSDEPGRSGLAAAASDTWITSKAKVRLMATPGISPLAVNVDTRRGTITLFGKVPTEAKKQAAEREVRKISGVKGVANELQVVPDVAAERIEKQDDQLKAAVVERLGARTELQGAEIGVEVNNAVVRLTGDVASFGDKARALKIARTTEGVDSIVDDLEVRPNQAGG